MISSVQALSILAHINWLYALSGFLVGALVGLTGVGGGSLMTPLLVLMFGIAPPTAVGTDLLYAALTKSGGIVAHSYQRSIDWRIVRWLACGSVPATAVTILVLAWVGVANSKQHGFITTTLGIALVLTAAALLARKFLIERVAPLTERLSDRQRNVLTLVLGVLIGIFVSVSSVGAGAIGVTMLLSLYPRAPLVRIVGSDIAHAVPLTLVAGLGHWWWLGSVDLPMLGSLLVGSLPGIFLTSLIGGRAPDALVRPILAGTLAIVGFRLAL